MLYRSGAQLPSCGGHKRGVEATAGWISVIVKLMSIVWTSLIHSFMAVTFSVELGIVCENFFVVNFSRFDFACGDFLACTRQKQKRAELELYRKMYW